MIAIVFITIVVLSLIIIGAFILPDNRPRE